MLYVIGGQDENEALLYQTLLALRDSLNILLKFVLLHDLHELCANTRRLDPRQTREQS